MKPMPDTLNKQSLVNLLIDSPLREPIKINLIDIVNNTSDVDLPKVFPTIVKELEIFQKATERRMKLAEETIAKLGGSTPSSVDANPTPMPPTAPQPDTLPTPEPMPAATPDPGLSVPPLDLPPLPSAPVSQVAEPVAPATPMSEPAMPPVAPSPMPEPASAPLPTPVPLGGDNPASQGSDEAALAEIQKELDSLKTSTAEEITAAAAPAPAPSPVQQ